MKGHTATVAVPKVLANPNDPDLWQALLIAAAAITETQHKNTHLWLQGGLLREQRLVDSLLRILRSLPTLPLSKAAATDTCAAIAAILVNIFCVAKRHPWVLPGSDSIHTLVAQIVNPDVLGALVQYGMVEPCALAPLHPGIHVEVALEDGTLHGSQPGWTTLRVCCHLLAALALHDAWPDHVAKVRFVVGELAVRDVFQHLLEIALAGPCDMPWLVMATVSRCNRLRAKLCWCDLVTVCSEDSQRLVGPLLEQMQVEDLAAVSAAAAAGWEECWQGFAEMMEEKGWSTSCCEELVQEQQRLPQLIQPAPRDTSKAATDQGHRASAAALPLTLQRFSPSPDTKPPHHTVLRAACAQSSLSPKNLLASLSPSPFRALSASSIASCSPCHPPTAPISDPFSAPQSPCNTLPADPEGQNPCIPSPQHPRDPTPVIPAPCRAPPTPSTSPAALLTAPQLQQLASSSAAVRQHALDSLQSPQTSPAEQAAEGTAASSPDSISPRAQEQGQAETSMVGGAVEAAAKECPLQLKAGALAAVAASASGEKCRQLLAGCSWGKQDQEADQLLAGAREEAKKELGGTEGEAVATAAEAETGWRLMAVWEKDVRQGGEESVQRRPGLRLGCRGC